MLLMDPLNLLSTAHRTGALDPTRLASLGAAAAAWGPTTAAAYGAAALRHPRRTAIIDDVGEITYFQLDVRTTRVAGGLRSVGVRAGQSVGLMCRNHRGFVEANVALAKLGARPLYLNPMLPTSQLVAVIERECVQTVIVEHDLAHQLLECEQPVTTVSCDPGESESWSFPALPKWRPFVPRPRLMTNDQPIVLTSGTTGAPKGTRRSAGVAALSGVYGVLEAVPVAEGDVSVIAAPLFHAWGLSQLLLGATLAHTVVLRSTFDPAVVAADVDRHHADVLIAVPVMLQRILHLETPAELSSLRIVASSGSALPGELATRWIERHGSNLYSLYGSTEVGQVSIASPQQLSNDPASGGSLLRGIEVRIVDEDGTDLAPGEVGQIMVKSGMHFDGYTDGGNKEMLGDYMSIGDLGSLSVDGELRVLGRVDDMIVTGGENVFPSNIERALAQCPEVAESAVVGVANDEFGQIIRAVIVLRSGRPGAKMTVRIKEQLREVLVRHELPRDFVYVDALPRNDAGKVLRRQLS